ncbi:MAG: hypothetical protein IT230_12315 [Flavobacteriales bacterium]|nr:hypothetical protein [Flavobacteriales bacterium]
MSKVHYFPRYHQRENVITNNTLLLFNLINKESPVLFEAVLNTLFEEQAELSIGIQVEQQGRIKHGTVPDANISQQSFRLVIETKRGTEFHRGQIEGHLSAFGDEAVKVLLLLGNERINDPTLNKLLPTDHDLRGVRIISRSFEDVIRAVRESTSERDMELRDLVDDYRQFCDSMNVLPWSKYWLRANTANRSRAENLKYGVYYESLDKGTFDHHYLGLYGDKEVFAIGEMVNSVKAELKDGELVNVESDKGKEVTADQRDRIKAIISAAKVGIGGYDVSKGCRFFVVDKFHETHFKKSTPFPIRKWRDFDLRDYLGKDLNELPPVAEIAKRLQSMTWEKTL